MIEAGVALRVTDGGIYTVTWTESVAVPPSFVAVMVYVVVSWGATSREPLELTAPIPGTMVTLSVFDELQVRVAALPKMIASGEAVMLAVGGVTVCMTVMVR
jgi:hypothetical protein